MPPRRAAPRESGKGWVGVRGARRHARSCGAWGMGAATPPVVFFQFGRTVTCLGSLRLVNLTQTPQMEIFWRFALARKWHSKMLGCAFDCVFKKGTPPNGRAMCHCFSCCVLPVQGGGESHAFTHTPHADARSTNHKAVVVFIHVDVTEKGGVQSE